MTNQLLLIIIASGVTIIAGISLINFLQKLGFNVYHKIRVMLNPQMKAHKRELKKQKAKLKAQALLEELNKE